MPVTWSPAPDLPGSRSAGGHHHEPVEVRMAPWDDFLTEQDKAVFAAGGYGARAELGERPALLVVDVTYGFCGDRAEPILESIKRWRSSCGERAWEALPYVGRLLEVSRGLGVPVIYTRGASRRADGFDRGRWADKNRRQAADTPETDEFVAEIAPDGPDLVIEKRKPSAFFGTTLASHLVSLKADTLIICGTSTSGCVRATVTDAFSYDYRVAIAEEATFDRGQASHAMALFDLDMKYANVTPVDEIVTYLKGLVRSV
jgi:nicotinamidase-related amidase